MLNYSVAELRIIYNELFLPIEMKEICLEKIKAKLVNKKAEHTYILKKKITKISPLLKHAKISLVLRFLRTLGLKYKFPSEN